MLAPLVREHDDQREQLRPHVLSSRGVEQRAERASLVPRGRALDELAALIERQVSEQVQHLRPQVRVGGGLDDPVESLVREHADEVLQAVLRFEHERDVEQRGVVDHADGGHDRVRSEMADEPAHRHVLLAADQLAGDRRDLLGRDPADDLARPPWVKFDRDVGEKPDR